MPQLSNFRMNRLTIKNIFAILALLGILFFSVYVIVNLGKNNQTVNVANIPIPDNAIVVARINNIALLQKQMSNGNLIVAQWKKAKIVNSFLDELVLWDTLAHKCSFTGPLYVSLHPAGAKNHFWLFSWPTTPGCSTDQILSAAGYKKTNERSYENETIEQWLKSESTLYTLQSGNFHFASSSVLIIEDLIHYLHKDKILSKDSIFNQVNITANLQASTNIFIQWEKTGFFHEIIQDNSSLFPLPGNMSGWLGIDLHFKADLLFLTGYCSIESRHFLAKFFGQQQQKIQCPDFITHHVTWAIQYNINDFKTYLLQSRNASQKNVTIEIVDEIEKKYAFDFLEELASVIGPEFYLFNNHMPASDRYDFPVFACKLKENDGFLSFVSRFSPVSDTLPYYFIPGEIFQPFVPFDMTLPDTLFGFIFKDEYAIMAESKEHLNELKILLFSGEAVNNQNIYQRSIPYLVDEADIWYWINPQHIFSNAEKVFKKDFLEKSGISNEILSTPSILTFQFDLKSGNRALFNLVYAFKTDTSAPIAINQLFEYKHNNNIIHGPYLFPNHINHSYDLFFQDDQGNFGLIDNTGKLIWQKSLESPIISPPIAVDKYNNGKWQIVFNTGKQIFFLDRNGNHLNPFPITPQENTRLPVSVLDYDNNHNYRILWTGSSALFNFDLNGQSVEGWNHSTENDTLIIPPFHFAVEGKDHITYVTRKGMIKSTDRRGSQRINQYMAYFNPDIYFFKKGRTPATSYIFSFKNGFISQKSLNGEEILLPFSADTCYFIGSLNNDKWADMVLYQNNSLVIMDEAGNVIFQKEMPRPTKLKLDQYNTKNKENILAIALHPQNIIYILRNFKIDQSLPFDAEHIILQNINLDDNPELIIRKNNTVKTYQLLP